jgi:uncharacterized protein YjiS (DUF1127 family)
METTMTSVNYAHTNLGRLAQRALTLPVQWATRFRERRELMALLDLPDYLLKDIGIKRDDITREGVKHFWQ